MSRRLDDLGGAAAEPDGAGPDSAEPDGAEPEDFLASGTRCLLVGEVGLPASEFMLDFLEAEGRAVPLYPVIVELVVPGRGFGVSCNGFTAVLPENLGTDVEDTSASF